METEIIERFTQVKKEVEEAAAKSGRKPDDATLLVVSKTWPADVVVPIIKEGHLIYGESRVKEATEKVSLLPEHLEWHLIGHLQKNKARKALELFPVIHSVDSLELAQQLNRIAGEDDRNPKVYLQVNVAGEEQKFGFSPQSVAASLDQIRTLDRLEIVGLMVIPPFTSNPEDSRSHFIALRKLRDQLASAHDIPLPGLSMGMSHDYAVAIEEGATIVRVGSSIFGPRLRKA